MGLDMYLRGHKFTPNYNNKHQRQRVDGYEVTSLELDLGQWCKHWALHTYINSNYGNENRHQFPIDKEELLEIADAVEQGRLPDAGYSPEIDVSTTKNRNRLRRLQKSFEMPPLGSTVTTASGAM